MSGAAYLNAMPNGTHKLIAWEDGLPALVPVVFGAGIPAADILSGAAHRRLSAIPADPAAWREYAPGRWRVPLTD